ncbi:hypothetical protein, partial [Escherichia coli]
PAVTTALLDATGRGSSVAWFMIGSASVSLICLLLLAETLRNEIHEQSGAPAAAPTQGAPTTI